MLVMNALTQLATQPGCLMRRPTGVAVQIKERMQMVTFRTGAERRWCPKYRDLVADDWEIISFERLLQEIQATTQQVEPEDDVEADADHE